MTPPLSQPMNSRLDALRLKWKFRSAETGRYVTRAYALLFPASTVRERV